MVCNFIKKANQTQFCSCELWEFFKNTFFTDHLWVTASLSSSVIRQKGESQNGCYKKTKHAKFSETNISYSLIHTRACTYQGVRKVRLSENLRAFFSCNTRFEIRPFGLLPMSFPIFFRIVNR